MLGQGSAPKLSRDQVPDAQPPRVDRKRGIHPARARQYAAIHDIDSAQAVNSPVSVDNRVSCIGAADQRTARVRRAGETDALREGDRTRTSQNARVSARCSRAAGGSRAAS